MLQFRPKKQREAVKLIIDECLSIKDIDLPRDVILSLNQDPNLETGSMWDAPLRAIIATGQQAMVSTLMDGARVERMVESAFKVGEKNSYTVVEHYNTITNAVFSELTEGKDISGLRRDLQRFQLEGLMIQHSAPSGLISEDVRMVAGAQIRRLKQLLTNAARNGGLNAMTKAHLADLLERISRYEQRQITSDR